jgi:hypothetical protein
VKNALLLLADTAGGPEEVALEKNFPDRGRPVVASSVQKIA